MYSKKISFLALLLSVFVLPLYAQVNDPALWESYVNSPTNTVVCDTFRFQSFEGNPTDNWIYECDNEVLFDANTNGIKGQGGNYSLKLFSEDNVRFERFDPSFYKNVKVTFGAAAQHLSLKSALHVQAQNFAMGITIDSDWTIMGHNDYSFSYREKMYDIKEGGSRYRDNPITMPNIYSLAISILKTPGEGYLCIDSVYAYGDIPTNSLFAGKGNWQDTANWTHLPAERHRNAFIKGDITANRYIKCNNIHLSNGSIHINKGNQLSVNNLSLYDTNAFLTSEGNIQVSGKLTVHRTFEEKGEWYFISFPFDVYPEGINPAFQMKDATPNDGGNYFYVLAYNGDKRQSTNTTNGNWDVLSPSQLSGRPVFEKNKGYLIALDEKATINTLSFSSSGKIPEDFGSSGLINIQVTNSPNGNNANSGWYLCGNPFAAPLSLRQIPENPNLDGYIYVYDGTTYTPYPIGSNYQLPPFSAFFVKAKASTDIPITKTQENQQGVLLSLSAPLRLTTSDPIVNNPSSTTCVNSASSTIKGSTLCVNNLQQQANLFVYNQIGKLVFKQAIPSGTSTIRLPLSSGFYILRIDSPTYRAQHKCIITQ